MKTNSAILESMPPSMDDQATALTCARYQRILPSYDKMERLMDRRSRPWREKLWQWVSGPQVLEVGVGTGKNIEF